MFTIKEVRKIMGSGLTFQHEPNRPFQRTRATKRLGVFKFCEVARGAECSCSPKWNAVVVWGSMAEHTRAQQRSRPLLTEGQTQ